MTKYFLKTGNKKHLNISKIINLILLFIVIYHFIYLVRDEIILNEYLNTNFSIYKNRDSLEYKDILTIRNFIISEIDNQLSINEIDRPKMGLSVGTIINEKKGLCGEASRLLFFIYRKFGIDARRVYLHGSNAVHVVLEVNYENKWILLETFNSYFSDIFRSLLDNTKGSIYSFFRIGPKRFHISPDSSMASFGYNNFSYLPLNGIFNNSITKTEIYVHEPFNSLINYILESPPLFYILMTFFFILIFNARRLVSAFNSIFGKSN